jgi:hypothetical protein
MPAAASLGTISCSPFSMNTNCRAPAPRKAGTCRNRSQQKGIKRQMVQRKCSETTGQMCAGKHHVTSNMRKRGTNMME